MNGVIVICIEIVSAALSFIIARFMVKLYRYTGEGRYIGLPLGFAFLAMSYLFMGLAMSSSMHALYVIYKARAIE